MKIWSLRGFRKKDRKRSVTTGKSKGGNCQASSLDKYFASRNRSYKHKLYSQWLEKTRKYH